MNRDNPYFSIIIPTYERPGQLARCLKSVARLDYPREKFEVIVVDDGSLSPPEELVQSYSDRLDIRLITQKNAGPAGARNTGAQNANGVYLAFTDDDCEPDINWLKAYEEEFKKNPDNLMGGDIVNALQGNPYSTASQLLVNYLYTYYNPEPGSAKFFTSNNIAVPKELFLESGGFDVTTLRATAEDRELCDRWLFQGRKLTYIDQAVVHHSHKLSLLSFWRQHFNYGRGAYYFRKVRAIRGQEKIKLEPGTFYRNLIRYPHKRKVKNLYFISLLMILSQISNGLGYYWERAVQTINST